MKHLECFSNHAESSKVRSLTPIMRNFALFYVATSTDAAEIPCPCFTIKSRTSPTLLWKQQCFIIF